MPAIVEERNKEKEGSYEEKVSGGASKLMQIAQNPPHSEEEKDLVNSIVSHKSNQ